MTDEEITGNVELMDDHFKDRRRFLRIPMASVVQLGLEGEDLGRMTLFELEVEGKNILSVELDRDTSPPRIEFAFNVGVENSLNRVDLDPGSNISLRVPLLEEPDDEVNMPMVSMIRVSTDNINALAAMLVDISAGGARIMCQFPLLRNHQVTLKIPLAGEGAVEVTGKIIWVRQMKLMREFNFGVEYMVGIKFDEPCCEIRDYISRHMNR